MIADILKKNNIEVPEEAKKAAEKPTQEILLPNTELSAQKNEKIENTIKPISQSIIIFSKPLIPDFKSIMFNTRDRKSVV